MRVLFISRASFYSDKGGDTIQALNTAEQLRQLGVSIDIKLCNERIDYSKYDLIHFFNIIRPADILRHIQKSGKPFVVSTIYVDYSEYEKKMRKGIAGWLFRTIPPDLIEYAKAIARSVVGGEKIISPSYILLGQKRSVKKIIRQASMLLPNSENEYKRLVNHFQIGQKYRVIPNAIDPELFNAVSGRMARIKNRVLCVGRIEGRKNQLNLIKAIKGSTFELFVIGSPAPNQSAYYKACKQAAGPNVHFIENIPQEKLIDFYLSAQIHVLPSWFETTGLSSLEAAAMGCQIVVTDKGDTREYFENLAHYCDPSLPDSILKAIEEAAIAKPAKALQEKIITKYIWPVTAAKTLEAYKIALQ